MKKIKVKVFSPQNLLQNIVYISNKRRTNCATAVSVSCVQVEETICGT